MDRFAEAARLLRIPSQWIRAGRGSFHLYVQDVNDVTAVLWDI